jgi:T5SS/PEP-CTERM-associated repeat protein
MSSGTDLVVGFGAGSVGTYTLSGTGAVTASQSEFIGSLGSGTFTQSAGTNTLLPSAVGYLNMGTSAGATGTYNLSGGSLVANKNEVVGDAGSGIFNQTGGTNTIQGAGFDLQLGNQATGNGTYTISNNAILNAGNNVSVGVSGTGTLNIQGTSLVNVTNAVNINPSSFVYINGGALRLNSTNAPGRIFFNSGKLQLGGDRTIGTDAIISAQFGSSPVIPSGKELAVEGNAFITAPLSINGGKLSFTNVNHPFYLGTSGNPMTLSVTNGGSLSQSGLVNVSVENGSTLNVDGLGSTVTGVDVLFIGGNTTNGYMNISGGASVICPSNLYVGTTTPNSTGQGVVTVTGMGSTLTTANLTVGSYTPGTLTIQDNAVVNAVGLQGTIISGSGILNLSGGTLHTSDIRLFSAGKFNFNSGTVQWTGDRSLGSDPDIANFYGASPNLQDGKGLGVDGTATLVSSVTINGGTFSAGQIVYGGNLILNRGKFNLTNQILTIGAGGLLGSTLDLNDDMTVNVTLGTTNQGLVTGDGEIGGTLTNSAAGELRGEPGKSLKLTGANNVNAGQINLFGGMVEFTQNLTNNGGALVTGNGTLKVGTSLTNSGTMNFSGLANIVGDVTNNAGAKIISSGGGPTTFHDDVINNGEIRTSAGSFTTFFGATSGSGSYTGTGTVNFEGDLKPGNSPASISFGGNMALGVDAALKMELGGLAAGSQYDQVAVVGNLALGGVLQITLINSFTPAAGNSFNLLDWGSLSGTFASLSLPALGSGLSWDTSQLYTTGVVRVTSAGILGDYNNNGTVDAGDYILYRKYAGTTHVLPNDPTGGTIGAAQYMTWQFNFGRPPGSGTGSGIDSAGSAVPEPASLVLLLLLAAGSCLGRRCAF